MNNPLVNKYSILKNERASIPTREACPKRCVIEEWFKEVTITEGNPRVTPKMYALPAPMYNTTAATLYFKTSWVRKLEVAKEI
jgi:hypothetical protein